MRELRVRVLGPFEVEGVASGGIGSRKARMLLKVLAVAAGGPVSVDRIVDVLWGSTLPARPADQVAVLVSRLRGAIGSDRIVRGDAGYALAADWLDLHAFRSLAAQAASRLGADAHTSAHAAASAALALVRGPLLNDEPGTEWADAERGPLRRLVAETRRVGARAAIVAGDPSAGIVLAAPAVEEDGYDESALRLLMQAYAMAGRPATALEAYERMRRRLSADLGVDPAPETRQLHASILAGDARPPRPTAGPAADADAPLDDLPGRAHQLRRLLAAFDDARSRRTARVVVLEGEAGIGKTRVLEALGRALRSLRVAVLTGRCDEFGRPLALEPVLRAVAEHLDGLSDATDLLGDRAAVLGPLLGTGSPATAEGSGGIAAMIGDHDTARTLLFGSVLAVVERSGAASGAALLVDDGHLADDATLEWLRFVQHRGTHAPLLVVVARRSEEDRPIPADDVVTVDPLDLDAVAAVVGTERAAELHARSGGNPLFLVELAAHADDDALPVTIRDAVASRCARAGRAAETLRAAAVVGAEIDLELLAATLRRPHADLLDDLEEGVRRRFLEERGTRLVFRHDLVREALVAGVSATRRSLLHRQVALALDARPLADPLHVAYHARLGGDTSLAAAACVRAARRASERYDHAEAERLSTEAIVLEDGPAARVERSRTRIILDRLDDAEDDARSALAFGAGAPALEVAGWIAYYRRDLDTALRLASDGARLATEPSIIASCLALAGRIRHSGGDVAGAERSLEEAVRVASGRGLAVASVWLASLRCHNGRPGDALPLLHSAEMIGLDSPFAVAHLHLHRAYAFGLAGRIEDAFAALDALEQVVERTGADRYAGRAANWRAWIFRNLGDLERADALNERAFEEARRFGLREPMVQAICDLADGQLRRGSLDAADASLRRAESQPRGYAMHWRVALRTRLLRARLAAYAGELDEARAAALGLAADARAIGMDRYETLATFVAAAAGEPLPAEDVDRLASRSAREAGLESWWLLAELAAATRSTALWDAAAERVDELARRAGSHAAVLTGYARRRFDAADAPPASRGWDDAADDDHDGLVGHGVAADGGEGVAP